MWHFIADQTKHSYPLSDVHPIFLTKTLVTIIELKLFHSKMHRPFWCGSQRCVVRIAIFDVAEVIVV